MNDVCAAAFQPNVQSRLVEWLKKKAPDVLLRMELVGADIPRQCRLLNNFLGSSIIPEEGELVESIVIRFLEFIDAMPVASDPPATPGPRKPPPVLPAEVHNPKPISPDAAWSAVVAMCRGG